MIITDDLEICRYVRLARRWRAPGGRRTGDGVEYVQSCYSHGSGFHDCYTMLVNAARGYQYNVSGLEQADTHPRVRHVDNASVNATVSATAAAVPASGISCSAEPGFISAKTIERLAPSWSMPHPTPPSPNRVPFATFVRLRNFSSSWRYFLTARAASPRVQ